MVKYRGFANNGQKSGLGSVLNRTFFSLNFVGEGLLGSISIVLFSKKERKKIEEKITVKLLSISSSFLHLFFFVSLFVEGKFLMFKGVVFCPNVQFVENCFLCYVKKKCRQGKSKKKFF